MESPGMAWIPGFRSVADQAFLVAHETAHQWFYGIVGNDQATDAFADEAMAEYLSRKARGVMRASRCRRDRLDKSIHAYRPGCYYETIYVQGALFLDDLRRDFGNEAFRRAIRRYARRHDLAMGSDRMLLEAFRQEMGNKVLKRFRQRFPSLY
jgi:aminopeptidase N